MVHHNLGDVFVNTHLNLAKTYEKAGFREKSIEQYRILQRADPNNREAHDALTRLQ